MSLKSDKDQENCILLNVKKKTSEDVKIDIPKDVDSTKDSGKCSENSSIVSQKTNKKILSNFVKRPPVDIEFSNLCYSVNDEKWNISSLFYKKCGSSSKQILKGINGEFKSGELIAIMGPSGAGKSTLMNILAGYKTSNIQGQITINKKPRNLRKFRKMSCYIMQDDCLSPHLSVSEAMEVAANLKLGEKSTPEAKKQIIREIVSHLSLDDCMDTRTNRISGGQRKRLAIALELVNNPPVMFLDEPTSGLDSSSSWQCIGLLKQLAREGRTIICTIHQPSARIFEMFDNIYLLAEGYNIYKGSVPKLLPFFSSLDLTCPSYHNPADFILEVSTGEYGNHLEKMVEAIHKIDRMKKIDPVALPNKTKKEPLENSEESSQLLKNNDKKASEDIANESKNSSRELSVPNTKDEDAENGTKTSMLGSNESLDGEYNGFPTSTCTQYRILFIRTFKSILRDETLTKLRVISHIFIGIILGFLYWDIGNEASKVHNNSAMLFFCMLFCMFSAMMTTVMTFPLEMGTFKREHLNYWYSMKSYYLAKVTADMPFQIILPAVFVAIVYFMTSQPLEVSRFGMFMLMSILTSLVAQTTGLVIGCAFDVQSSVFLGPITTIPILLFSGFFITIKNIPSVLQWLTYVAYVRYAFEGTMLSIYGFDRSKMNCSVAYCHFKYPQKFLEEMALENGIFWVDVVALISIFISLRILGYFVLKLKLKAER